ncbi:hypothetical protein YB2330_005825 [Saitoella coloradoensis]
MEEFLAPPASAPGHHRYPYPYPPTNGTCESASHLGYSVLWATYAIFLLSSLFFIFLASRVEKSLRLFHYVTTAVTLIAAVSYYAMATHSGSTCIPTPHSHDVDHAYRQVFWARYVDWFFTTPLLLMDLAFLAGMGWVDIILLTTADQAMILLGLFAGLKNRRTGHGKARWGWFVMSLVLFLYVVGLLTTTARRHAKTRGGRVRKIYDTLGFYAVSLWCAYPVVWALGEGTRKIGVDAEIIAYAVLDVMSKAVFGSALLIAHMRNPETSVPLTGFWNTLVPEGDSERARLLAEDDDEN